MAPTDLAMNRIPARVGVGLKPQHYSAIMSDHPDIGWFEIHAEAYMGADGAPHRHLAAVRERYPVSLHGIGLAIGAPRPLDRSHLNRLKILIDRYQPGLFSEHLAWSTHYNLFFNDLVPLPYNEESVSRVAAHVEQVQETLGRQMLLENPSTYVAFIESTMSEVDFLRAVADRTGCGLLLDVNNVHISATNQQCDPAGYLDSFPIEHVREVHIAGPSPKSRRPIESLPLDAEDHPVDLGMLSLYERAIERIGPVPTLIEWDNAVPEWPKLFAEAGRVDAVLSTYRGGDRPAVAIPG